jgi:tetratricopeptide (TPR) repeat protein
MSYYKKVVGFSVTKTISILLLFVALGFLIYSNSLDVPFIFDDVPRIQKNPQVRIDNFSFTELREAAFGKSSPKNRPIGNITFALNYYFHQYSLPGYHIVNIIIHILNGMLLYLFINNTLNIMGCGIWDVRCASKKSSKDKTQSTSFNHHAVTFDQSINSSFIAFFAALFWLVNPVHTQSVTYIVQRLNSLAAMFFIMSFLFYVKGRIVQKRSSSNPESAKSSKLKAQSKISALKFGRSLHYLWFIGSALTWILALGCKQIAATLPFFVFLYEWYFFQDLSREWLKHTLKYFFAILVLFGLTAFALTDLNPLEKIISGYAQKDFTLIERVLTEFRVVIYYLGLLFYPHPSRLKLYYDFGISHSLIDPITTLLSFGAIIGLIVLAFYLARKDRLISFCIVLFFGNLIIESSIIPLAIIFEHRTYLPSMFVCLLVVVLVFRYLRKKWIAAGILCAAILVFSIWTYQRNIVWKDAVSLWSDNVQKTPNKAGPRNGLGLALFEQSRIEEAIFQYREALRIKPDDAEIHNNLGVALEGHGSIKKAIHHYSQAIFIRPDYAEALNNLGVALARQGKDKEAIDRYSQALRINPDYAEAHNNLGLVLARQGRLKEAIIHYSQALRMNADYAEGHYNLGLALEGLGRFNEAFHHYSEALRIKPAYGEAHINLGNILVREGRTAEAVRHYTIALRINPDFEQAHNNLGFILAQQGKTDEAIRHYHKAILIKPAFVQALSNLAVAYTTKGKYDEAISWYKKIIDLRPDGAGAYYNMACIYSTKNKIEESIDCLKKSIENGFKDWDLLKTDKDLENIRNSSFFKELLKNH